MILQIRNIDTLQARYTCSRQKRKNLEYNRGGMPLTLGDGASERQIEMENSECFLQQRN